MPDTEARHVIEIEDRANEREVRDRSVGALPVLERHLLFVAPEDDEHGDERVREDVRERDADAERKAKGPDRRQRADHEREETNASQRCAHASLLIGMPERIH